MGDLVKCNECGAALKEGMRFCWSCGAPVSACLGKADGHAAKKSATTTRAEWGEYERRLKLEPFVGCDFYIAVPSNLLGGWMPFNEYWKYTGEEVSKYLDYAKSQLRKANKLANSGYAAPACSKCRKALEGVQIAWLRAVHLNEFVDPITQHERKRRSGNRSEIATRTFLLFSMGYLRDKEKVMFEKLRFEGNRASHALKKDEDATTLDDAVRCCDMAKEAIILFESFRNELTGKRGEQLWKLVWDRRRLLLKERAP